MELYKKIKYCWEMQIKVYPVPVNNSEGNRLPRCKIEIDYQGTKRQGTEVYKQELKMYDKIDEIYEAYYKKLIS